MSEKEGSFQKADTGNSEISKQTDLFWLYFRSDYKTWSFQNC